MLMVLRLLRDPKRQRHDEDGWNGQSRNVTQRMTEKKCVCRSSLLVWGCRVMGTTKGIKRSAGAESGSKIRHSSQCVNITISSDIIGELGDILGHDSFARSM